MPGRRELFRAAGRALAAALLGAGAVLLGRAGRIDARRCAPAGRCAGCPSLGGCGRPPALAFKKGAMR